MFINVPNLKYSKRRIKAQITVCSVWYHYERVEGKIIIIENIITWNKCAWKNCNIMHLLTWYLVISLWIRAHYTSICHATHTSKELCKDGSVRNGEQIKEFYPSRRSIKLPSIARKYYEYSIRIARLHMLITYKYTHYSCTHRHRHIHKAWVLVCVLQYVMLNKYYASKIVRERWWITGRQTHTSLSLCFRRELCACRAIDDVANKPYSRMLKKTSPYKAFSFLRYKEYYPVIK